MNGVMNANGKREPEDRETIKRLSERIAWLEALNEVQALRLRRLEAATHREDVADISESAQNGAPPP
jgi:hypothetical protein